MNESVDFDGAWRMQTGPLAGFSHLGDSEIHVGKRVNSNPAQLALLLVGVCGGCLDLLIFMMCGCRRSLNLRSLTVFQVSLIVSRILQLMSSVVMVMWFFGDFCSTDYCYKLFVVWYATRRSGTILHLLAALEFKLSRRGPKAVHRFVHVYWTLPVVLTVNLLCLLFHEVLEAALFFGALVIALTILICFFFCCCWKKDPEVTKVVLCACFAFVTYLPSFVMECLAFSSPVSGTLYEILECLTNLRLLVDGYVCWVTGRELRETAQQTLEAGNVNLDPVSQIPD